jgi:phosphoglucomutase
MAVQLSEHSGKAVETSMLINVPRLVTESFAREPDPGVPSQRVAFGTSSHRGSALDNAFNEAHILAITQVICQYRRSSGITGPLFIGIDTHALSEPALTSALEVLAGADVDVMIDAHAGYTPTPVISRAILTYNRNRGSRHADGIIITPSHNSPEDGGFKYDPPNGGPANTDVTSWIERTGNDVLEAKLNGLVRIPYERALKSPRVHRHDFTGPYVGDLVNVVDMDIIRSSGVKIGIDSPGGASAHFWRSIIGHYGARTTIVNEMADRTFRFITVDWDGEIRMDCSSAYAMADLIAMRDKFGIAFANDTDADRRGVVTRSVGLMNPNHYLAPAISYLFSNRPGWAAGCGIGKTIVSSGIIERVAAQAGRTLVELPVEFKWFVDGLINGSLGFAGEESAGASFLRRDGSVSTTG